MSSIDPQSQNIFADYEVLQSSEQPKNKPDNKTILKHSLLFILTLLSVTLVGSNFVGFNPVLFPFSLPDFTDFLRGLLFAVLLLAFLTVHEFGHYFAAVYHNVRVTLPYYIPIPLGIGTFGAVIRIKERINRTYKLFDIGVTGPVAGFVVSFVVLLIGFATLPEADYIQQFFGHEEVKAYVAETGVYPDEPTDAGEQGVLTVGNTLLYSLLGSFFDNVPPMWEMYHFPFLFAGWLGLFFTALNLMPVGQLDGGHILYSLLGFKKHAIVARLFYTCITALAGIEMIPLLNETMAEYISMPFLGWIIWLLLLFSLMYKAFMGNRIWVLYMMLVSVAASTAYLLWMNPAVTRESSYIWLVWSILIAFIIKVEHPPVAVEEELSTGRKVTGWLSMLIFILCISPNPIFIQ